MMKKRKNDKYEKDIGVPFFSSEAIEDDVDEYSYEKVCR